jgi:uncharacterized protein YigA (DUF484 family)
MVAGREGADEHLHRIQALTDPTLTRLDLDEMLVELLDRVREILDADTAAILLLDETSQQLVARAARGIEEEVHQGVRIPVRQGFAGRIAAERRPVVLDRVDPTTVANPILWEKGIQAMLGVPMMSGDALFGVLHVGTLGARRFTREDAELLELVAGRVALATQSRLLKAERAAAKMLEQSLTPTALPAMPGFEVAARYVTAEGRDAGGDWYDAFCLPSGQVWITAGDVAGHGLKAAVVMGRLRTTIRAHALQGAGPAEVVRLTDAGFQHFEPDEMATAICIAVTPGSDEMEICSAGHPRPILALPDGTVEPIEITPEPPLGAIPDRQRHVAGAPFPPGAVVVLYTDGLVEKRGEPLDVGVDRLRRVVTTGSPDIQCRQIMLRLVGETVPQDDIALIVMRHLAPDT